MAVEEEKRKNHKDEKVMTGNEVKTCRRFSDSGAAAEELYIGFNDWSSSLASYGLQTAYAIIAANWAVYGSADKILCNDWARASMMTIILFLGVNLLCAGWMTKLYKSRCIYADTDKKRWEREFVEGQKKPSPWPYTNSIQNLGNIKRLLNIWAPVVAGAMFIISLF